MKTTSAISSLLAIAAVASASPVQRDTPGTFTMLSIHSGNQFVHLEPIHANGNLFWIGRPTTSLCPPSPKSPAHHPPTTPSSGVLSPPRVASQPPMRSPANKPSTSPAPTPRTQARCSSTRPTQALPRDPLPMASASMAPT